MAFVRRLADDCAVGDRILDAACGIGKYFPLVLGSGPGEVYDHNLQATHYQEVLSWTARWRSPRGDRWWRVWACPDHLDGLTGLREFGRRR
jgi:hypothetical protein